MTRPVDVTVAAESGRVMAVKHLFARVISYVIIARFCENCSRRCSPRLTLIRHLLPSSGHRRSRGILRYRIDLEDVLADQQGPD